MPQKITKNSADRQEGKTNQKPSGYFYAPNMIFDTIFDIPLSAYAKLVYLYLCRCADSNGQSFPSHKDICKKCEIKSDRTVKNALKELHAAGLIVKEHRTREDGGQSSDLYTICAKCKTPTPQVADTYPPQVADTYEGLPIYKGLPIEGQLGVNALKEKDINSTDTNISQSVRLSSRARTHEEDKTVEDIDLTRQRIRDNIQINGMEPRYHLLANEFINIIVDTLHTKPGQYIRLAGEEKPLAVVQSAFLKLQHRHILHAIERFHAVERPITNKRGYLRTVLYNAWLEYESHYENSVNTQW